VILAWKAALIIFAGLISLEISAAEAAEKTVFPAPGGQQTILSVHGATDLAAMEPLIRDFQGLSPTVTVEYNEYLTNDLFNRAASECDAKQGTMDLVLSSSADHLVKLVNDGCALNYRSVMTHRLPSWTRWRDEVFGFTFEPAVIVYNRDLVPPEDVRRTRAELIDLRDGRVARQQCVCLCCQTLIFRDECLRTLSGASCNGRGSCLLMWVWKIHSTSRFEPLGAGQ